MSSRVYGGRRGGDRWLWSLAPPKTRKPDLTENAITAEGLDALRTELEQLETKGREEIAAQIKTAREWGDLKENAEYHAAKEAQAHLETRILKLRERVVSAEVVEVEGGDEVGFGSSVEVEDESTGKTTRY